MSTISNAQTDLDVSVKIAPKLDNRPAKNHLCSRNRRNFLEKFDILVCIAHNSDEKFFVSSARISVLRNASQILLVQNNKNLKYANLFIFNILMFIGCSSSFSNFDNEINNSLKLQLQSVKFLKWKKKQKNKWISRFIILKSAFRFAPGELQ